MSSVNNKAVKAIGLEINIGGLSSKISLFIFPKKKWKIIFLSLAQQIYSKLGLIKYSEIGVPSLYSPISFARQKANI
jgi:hypothetical protein